ncbi:hypothetical protein LCGC14_1296840 [marine sediment metagenome]|uniref:Uncharacterized protein n=1 Tax=marine sediment metagenome TaxID=412755 RepID=A0A0F9LBF5_9ZZZZ
MPSRLGHLGQVLRRAQRPAVLADEYDPRHHALLLGSRRGQRSTRPVNDDAVWPLSYGLVGDGLEGVTHAALGRTSSGGVLGGSNQAWHGMLIARSR